MTGGTTIVFGIPIEIGPLMEGQSSIGNIGLELEPMFVANAIRTASL